MSKYIKYILIWGFCFGFVLSDGEVSDGLSTNPKSGLILFALSPMIAGKVLGHKLDNLTEEK